MVHAQINAQIQLLNNTMFRCHWNQSQLARAIGVTPQSVSLWLRGNRALPKPVGNWIESAHAILDVIDDFGLSHYFDLIEQDAFGRPIQFNYSSAQILETHGLAMLIRLVYRDLGNLPRGF